MLAIEINNAILLPIQRPTPTPSATDVLIKVYAAGINRPDVMQRLGLYPAPTGASDIPGLEVSGTVVKVGHLVNHIKEGDKVRVFNDRGAFEGDAKITDDVNTGIVVATLGYWRQLNKGTVNCISSAEFVDMGHAPTFSDNLVQIELVK